MASSLTSDQVNYLIWRYLQESGFKDSAITFQQESHAARSDDVLRSAIKTGSLIHLIQRGLQYLECAARVNKDGSRKETAELFSFFPVEDEGVGEENGHVDGDGDESMVVSKSPTATSTTTQTNHSRKHGRDDGVNGISNAGSGGGGGGGTHKRRRRVAPGPDGDTPMTDGFLETPVPVEEPRVTNGRSVGVQVEDIVEITGDDSIILGQEDKSILICAWNPVHSTVVATASADSIARIWNVPLDATSLTALQNKVILHDPCNSPQREVTAIRWSPQGGILATGSYDGQTRIWTADGNLQSTLPPHHHAPVTTLRWNRLADTLLSMSCDGRVIAWNATGDMRRSFEQAKETTTDMRRGFEQAKETATDMDWVGDSQFVTCGNKGTVFIYDLDHDIPRNTHAGHLGEVNCVVWDQGSDRLASGGEDGAILIWNKPAKWPQPVARFQEHTAAIVSLCWQPSSSLSSSRGILASASNDCQIRLWDVVSKTCVNALRMHIDPVERISFSPDGSRLASGANGKVVIWNADTGAITHVYDGLKGRRKNGKVITVAGGDEGEIGEISWDEAGVRVAVGGGEAKCSIIRLKARWPVRL